MKLNEYPAKLRLTEAGIPIPSGSLTSTAKGAHDVALALGKPVVIKAQVPLSGRALLNGIQHAEGPDEAHAVAQRILNMHIKGLPVHQVLVEAAVPIEQELYIGITYDRTHNKPVLILSSQGGIELEHIAAKHPDTVFREPIAPLIGLRSFQVTTIASQLNLPREYWPELKRIALALYRCFVESDAELIEINPLAVTSGHRLIALDAKIIIDDNGLFRQPALYALRTASSESAVRQIPDQTALSYIKLNGQIGCVVNGAGLAMTIMDMIHIYSDSKVQPANFLDVGGGASVEDWRIGLNLVLSDPNVECALINVFGGTTRCDIVAETLVAQIRKLNRDIPIVVRLRGVQAGSGHRILSNAHLPRIHLGESLTHTVQTAIRLVEER